LSSPDAGRLAQAYATLGNSIICGASSLKLRHVDGIAKPARRGRIKNAQLQKPNAAVYSVWRESRGGDLDKRGTDV